MVVCFVCRSPGGTPLRRENDADDIITAALKEKFKSLRRQSMARQCSPPGSPVRCWCHRVLCLFACEDVFCCFLLR